MLQECKERISALNSQIEDEKNKQRQLRLDFEEQLEDLMGQHKDLWEFHVSHSQPFLPPYTSSLRVPGPKLKVTPQASFLSPAFEPALVA
nr:synaptonemal complex central element protein 1-like [Panthera onca]